MPKYLIHFLDKVVEINKLINIEVKIKIILADKGL